MATCCWRNWGLSRRDKPDNRGPEVLPSPEGGKLLTQVVGTAGQASSGTPGFRGPPDRQWQSTVFEVTRYERERGR